MIHKGKLIQLFIPQQQIGQVAKEGNVTVDTVKNNLNGTSVLYLLRQGSQINGGKTIENDKNCTQIRNARGKNIFLFVTFNIVI